MLWLTPTDVTLDGDPVAHVEAVIVDRRADELVLEHGETGPHLVFADVARQTSRVRLHRRLATDDELQALPGAEFILRFRTAPSASDARGRLVTIRIVITEVTTDVRAGRAATETIHAVAIAPDPSADPVVITRA